MRGGALQILRANIAQLKADAMLILYCCQIGDIYNGKNEFMLPSLLKPVATEYVYY
jgi:hypothetical protein